MEHEDAAQAIELSHEQDLALSEALGEQRGANAVMDLAIACLRKMADNCQWNNTDHESLLLASALTIIADKFARERVYLIRRVLEPKQVEEKTP